MREQNCIRYIWYAESENEGPNIHKPKHYNTFDNVRRSTSQKHSDRNQSARAWDNEAPDTRLLTTSDKDPSKTACRCSNQSLRFSHLSQLPAQIVLPRAHAAGKRKAIEPV